MERSRYSATLVIAGGIYFCMGMSIDMLLALQPAMAVEHAVSPTTMVWAVTVRGSTQLFSPMYGVLSDRLGHRLMLTLSLTALAVGTAASGLAGSFAGLLAAQTVAGLGSSGTGIGLMAYLSDLIAYRQRGRIIGLATTCSAIGTILGVPAALYLAQLTGLRSTFLALAALVIVLEFLSRAWLAPATRRPAEAAVTSLPGGWRNLCNSRRVRLGLLVWFLWSFVNGLPYTFMAAWLEDELQFQIGQTGLIWSSIGLGSCLGFLAVAVWSDRWGKRRFALIGLFANLVAITLMSYVTAAWLVFPIVFVYSLTDSLGRGAYSVFITELAPTERASAIALYRGVMGVAALLTPVIGGLVWPVGGFRLLALVVAGLGGLALLLATRWLPEAASDGPRPEWGRC